MKLKKNEEKIRKKGEKKEKKERKEGLLLTHFC